MKKLRQSADHNTNIDLGATTSALRTTADDFPLNIVSEQAAISADARLTTNSSSGCSFRSSTKTFIGREPRLGTAAWINFYNKPASPNQFQ